MKENEVPVQREEPRDSVIGRRGEEGEKKRDRKGGKEGEGRGVSRERWVLIIAVPWIYPALSDASKYLFIPSDMSQ